MQMKKLLAVLIKNKKKFKLQVKKLRVNFFVIKSDT